MLLLQKNSNDKKASWVLLERGKELKQMSIKLHICMLTLKVLLFCSDCHGSDIPKDK